MGKPTPGPWRLFPMGANEYDVICEAPGHYGTFLGLTTGHGAPDKLDADDQEQFEANARLIDKAWLIPELVEALEAAIAPFSEPARNPSGNPVGEPSWCAKARAALAKVNQPEN